MTEQTGWPSNSGEAVEVSAPAAVEMTQEQKDAIVAEWMNARTQGAHWVGYERDTMRPKLVSALFPDPKKGTQRYFDPAGRGAIKMVYGFDYKLGDKDLVDEATGNKVPIRDQVSAVVDKIEALGGPAARIIHERLITWSPSLSETEYLKLDCNDPLQLSIKELIDEILTVKPKTPSLEIEPPKAK